MIKLSELIRGWRNGDGYIYKRSDKYEVRVTGVPMWTNYTVTIQPVGYDSRHMKIGVYTSRENAMRQAAAALESWHVARFSVGKMEKD